MPLARILGLARPHRGAPLQAEALADRPEPPLAARAPRRRTATGSGSAGTASARRRASSTASSRPGTTGTCASSRRTSSRGSCSRTSAPRRDRRCSRRTATRSVTGAGSGCTTGSIARVPPGEARPRARRRPVALPAIEGSTDSEVFFFLALTLGLEDDPPAAVERAVGLIEHVGPRATASSTRSR